MAFTRTAEIVRDYVQKGSKLYIEGKIQTRSWDDKQSGEKRYRTEIIVNDISLLSGRDDQGGGSQQNNSYGNRSQSANGRGNYSGGTATATEPWDSSEISDDDIPF